MPSSPKLVSPGLVLAFNQARLIMEDPIIQIGVLAEKYQLICSDI